MRCGVVKKLLKKRRKTLLISLDWTDIRGFWTLMAATVVKGRSVPLCWASVEGGKFDKSRNSFEESLLLVLRQMIDPQLKVIILADRGFGRTELARFCQRHGFGYIIRISPDVWINGQGYHGKLLDYPVHKGIARLLKNVSYRSHHPVQQNIVIRWKPNLPNKRDECWFLMTDQQATPIRLSQSVWPADGGGGTVPRRQEQTQRLEPAGYADDPRRSPGPVDPDPGAGVSVAVRHRAAGIKTVSSR